MPSRRFLWLGVAVGVVLAVLSVPSPATAACITPPLRVLTTERARPDFAREQPTRVPVRAGQLIVVAGRGFTDGCHDLAVSAGCSAPPRPRPDVPAEDVDLVLEQGGRRWVLGTADAGRPGDQYPIRWVTRLPTALHAGTAHLVAHTTDVLLAVRMPAVRAR